MNRSRLTPRISPPTHQQLRQTLLQRNRTQSEVSVEGNRVDMVRIVRKNQQSRLSLVNIDYRQYMKQNQIFKNHQPWRHSESHHFSKLQQQNQNPDKEQEEDNLSSTFVHQGTELYLKHRNDPQLIQHYIRASNVNLLNEMNQQGGNKVLGLTLLCLFIVLFSSQTLFCSYFLFASHVIFDHFDYILVIDYQYYDEIFEQIEKDNFLPVLALYMAIQSVYHLIIFLINFYTKGKYKLIDKQSSRFSYIMKRRQFNRNSHSRVQKIMNSPKFTIFLILISTIASSYGIVRCYYYSGLNFIYVYFMSQQIVFLIEIFYFSTIFPEIWKYLFFDKIHTIEFRNQDNESSENQSQSSKQKANLLTGIAFQHWWIKLALIVLLASILYSLLISYWLIVVSLAKIQISFKQIKFKIDTFYLEASGKLLLLFILIFILFYRSQNQLLSFLTFDYSFQCIIFITLSFLLTRILSNLFLRQQLYKHLFTEMHINIAYLLFAFLAVFLVYRWTGEFQYLSGNIIVVGLMCFGLTISLYCEENHRHHIRFTQHYRQTQALVEMGNF